MYQKMEIHLYAILLPKIICEVIHQEAYLNA